MSNPQHMPTTQQRRQAETMAGCGIPHADIARAIGAVTGRSHSEGGPRTIRQVDSAVAGADGFDELAE